MNRAITNRPVGMLLLAAWLLLTGAVQLFQLSFNGLGVIAGVLAVAAGVLILMDR